MRILDFPIVRQSTVYTCSCASVQACLCYYGLDYREGQIRRLMRIDRNTQEIHPRKIVKALKDLGLKASYKKLTLNNLIKYIERGIPVIINLQAWGSDYNKDNSGHYAVAIGYDSNRVIFSDPSSFYRDYLSYTELEGRWHDGDVGDIDYSHMGIVVWGRRPVYMRDKIVHMD